MRNGASSISKRLFFIDNARENLVLMELSGDRESARRLLKTINEEKESLMESVREFLDDHLDDL